MRFCAVLRSYPKDVPGGAEFQAYNVCRELSRRGHESQYVAHQSEETSVEDDDGITVRRVSSDAGTETVLRTLEDVDADVYYFRLAPDLPLLWRAKRRLDAPIAYNVSRDVQCRSLLSPGPYWAEKGPIERLVGTGRYAFYRALLRVPDAILAQTRTQQRLLREQRGLSSTLVGNGHPVPEETGPKDEPPVVLWLATVKSVKQPGLFLDLVERCRDLDCRFWMVGHPVDGELVAVAREAEQEYEQFEYRGGCDVVESNEYFARSSIYVHTGNAEGFPNTFIQSWLRRTPVLSFDADPDSVLQTEDVGERCPSLDAASEALRRLVADPDHRAAVGDAARSYAVEHHSIEAVVDRLEGRLERLVA